MRDHDIILFGVSHSTNPLILTGFIHALLFPARVLNKGDIRQRDLSYPVVDKV